MRKKLLEELTKLSPEEIALQKGASFTDFFKVDYQEGIIQATRKHILPNGQICDLYRHFRFVHFPPHIHDYYEVVFMYSGSSNHVIDYNTQINLRAGELLVIKPGVIHEFLPIGYHDIAINIIMSPDFFHFPLLNMENNNQMINYIYGNLEWMSKSKKYLHFQIQNLLPAQNLLENMVFSLTDSITSDNYLLNRASIGILLVYLAQHTDTIKVTSSDQYEHNMVYTIMQYIENNFKTASLEEVSMLLKQPPYSVSRLIKKHTSHTFKELLREKRLHQAAFLLTSTTMPVERIIEEIGYDNTSYFHRLFKQTYEMTPKKYRDTHMLPDSAVDEINPTSPPTVLP